MEFLIEMDTSAKICCAVCALLLLYVILHSLRALKSNRIDNGAQNAVTIGVGFTFIGITIALCHFNTGNIADSIKAFLDGMKTAFFTSLMGMLAGIFIKWKQTTVIQSNERAINEKKIQNNAVLLQVHGCLQKVKDGINNVDKSINKTNSAELGAQLTELGYALRGFTEGTEATQKNMNELADTMKNQIGQLTNMLRNQLAESNQKQTVLLENMAGNIESMASKSKAAYDNSVNLMRMTEEFHSKSLETQDKSLAQLQDNTSQITGMKDSFDNFLSEMATRNNEAFIDALNKSIQELNQQLTEQLGDNFRHLDEAVKELNAWQNDYKQTIVDTTEELKNANSMFDEFTKQVIPETKASLEGINKCLGEYKECTSLNEKFAQELLQTRTTLVESGEGMKEMVEEFGRQSNRYISQSIENNNNFAEQSSSALKELKNVHETMAEQSKEMIEKVSTAVNAQIQKIGEAQEVKWSKENEILEENLNKINEMVRESGENFYLSTSDKLKKYNEMTEKSLKEISSTLEGFNVDFKGAISDSIAELNAQFATIAQSTGEQGKNAVQTLAGTLAEVSGKMVDNYEHLVDRIAEVDKLIAARGEN